MSIISTAEWKQNTATWWRDGGTVWVGGTVNCPPKGQTASLPTLPLGHHRSPALSTGTGPSQVRESQLAAKAPVPFLLSLRGEEHIHCTSQEVSPVGLAGVGKICSWTSVINSDWKRVLPSLYPRLGDDKVLVCFYALLLQRYPPRHRASKVYCSHKHLASSLQNTGTAGTQAVLSGCGFVPCEFWE